MVKVRAEVSKWNCVDEERISDAKSPNDMWNSFLHSDGSSLPDRASPKTWRKMGFVAKFAICGKKFFDEICTFWRTKNGILGGKILWSLTCHVGSVTAFFLKAVYRRQVYLCWCRWGRRTLISTTLCYSVTYNNHWRCRGVGLSSKNTKFWRI